MASSVFPADETAELQAQGLWRRLRALPATGGKIVADGRTLLNFSSNDYLNLAGDPRLKAAAARAVETFGCGATASRLMSGHLELHERLEAALARLTGRPTALVFGSGFLTNLGVLTALAGPRDAIFADRLNHASLVDGARLSGARLHRYLHAAAEHLEALLKNETGARRRIVVTESVFSMDGDLAPLAAIAAIARRHDALLVVDEAHAIGVLGPCGGGLCRLLEGDLAPDVVVGTLSKALGGYGGFAACSVELRGLLINRARSFIYSTGLPPASVAAGLAAAEIVMADPNLGPTLIGRARRLAVLLRERGLAIHSTPNVGVKSLDNDNAKSRPAEPASHIQEDLGSEIQDFKSQISNFKSRISNLKSEIRNPKPTTPHSASRLPHSFPEPVSPILPLMVGDNYRALALMEILMKKDILAVAVRPPTVPAGTARLRLSVTLAHDPADLERAAEAIADAAREAGVV